MKTIRLTITALVLVVSVRAQNGTCDGTGHVIGPAGPPYYGGDLCGQGVLTVGAVPNLWNSWATDYGYNGTTMVSGFPFANVIATNDAGLSVLRLTDGNTDPFHPGKSFVNNQTGGDEENTWGYNDTMVAFGENAGSVHFIARFYPNPTGSGSICGGKPFCAQQLFCSASDLYACQDYSSGTISPVELPATNVAFSQTTPYIIYDFESDGNCDGTVGSGNSGPCVIMRYDFTGCASTPTNCSYNSGGGTGHYTLSTIYDFASPTGGPGGTPSCLASSPQQTFNDSWNGTFSISASDLVFSFSTSQKQYTTGGQGTGTLAVEYTVGSGCRVWNHGSASTTSVHNPLTLGTQALGPNGGGGTVNTTGSGSCGGHPYCATWVSGPTGETGFPSGVTAIQIDNGTSLQLALTSVDGAGNYTGTITGGGGNALAGMVLTIVGFTNYNNDLIAQTVTGSTTTTLSFSGASTTVETPTGGAVASTGAVYAAIYINSTTLALTTNPGTQTGAFYRTGVPAGWIVGEYGPQGLTNMDGCYGNATCGAGPSAFLAHDSLGSRSDVWASISCSNCIGGSCGSHDGVDATDGDNPYYWVYSTLNVRAGNNLAGHNSKGYYSVVHGLGFGVAAIDPVVDSTGNFGPPYVPSTNDWNLLASVPAAGATSLDEHASGTNGNQWDTAGPIFSNTTHNNSNIYTIPAGCTNGVNCAHVADNGCGGSGSPYPIWTTALPNCGSGNPFTGPLVNELMIYQTSQIPSSAVYPGTTGTGGCISVNPSTHLIVGNGAGSGGAQPCTNFPIIRLGNNGITAVSPSFNATNGTVDFSQTGAYYSVTTDWWGTLGTDGTTPPVVGGPNWFKNQPFLVGDVITPIAGTGNYNWSYQASNSGTSCTGTTGANPCLNGSGTAVANPVWIAGAVCEVQYPTPCASGLVWNYIGQQNTRYDVIVGSTMPAGSGPLQGIVFQGKGKFSGTMTSQ